MLKNFQNKKMQTDDLFQGIFVYTFATSLNSCLMANTTKLIYLHNKKLSASSTDQN